MHPNTIIIVSETLSHDDDDVTIDKSILVSLVPTTMSSRDAFQNEVMNINSTWTILSRSIRTMEIEYDTDLMSHLNAPRSFVFRIIKPVAVHFENWTGIHCTNVAPSVRMLNTKRVGKRIGTRTTKSIPSKEAHTTGRPVERKKVHNLIESKFVRWLACAFACLHASEHKVRVARECDAGCVYEIAGTRACVLIVFDGVSGGLTSGTPKYTMRVDGCACACTSCTNVRLCLNVLYILCALCR